MKHRQRLKCWVLSDFKKEFMLDKDASFDTIGAKDERHNNVGVYGSYAIEQPPKRILDHYARIIDNTIQRFGGDKIDTLLDFKHETFLKSCINVPQGCFSLCKVLRKKKLFLNNNQIQLLNSNGNNLEDLTLLTDLHLEYNLISKLPDNIDKIQYLQVLNVSNNNLTCLPNSLGNLLYLSQLLIQNNQIEKLPLNLLTSTSSLEVIDVSENPKFHFIPINIMNLRKLRKFNFSSNYLQFPSQDICQQGIVEILKSVCKANQIPINMSFFNQLSNNEDNAVDTVDFSTLDYENFKRNRLDLLKSIESELESVMKSQKTFADKALHERMIFFNTLAEEEAKITNQINKMHLERDLHREQLMNDVKAAEADAANLIEEIMTINRTCQNQEKLLDEIESETMKKYHLYQISKDEIQNLRKQEVLASMSENLFHQRKIDKQNELKEIAFARSLNDKVIVEVNNERRKKLSEMKLELENQENEQKIAFQMLQIQKDIRSLRLTEHIYTVESELILLSQAEQKKREEKVDFKFNILNERRQQLVEILQNLIQQKALREIVLSKRMLEMEKQRQQDQDDFWLIQYQRCLDMKPHYLWNDSGLDLEVKELLSRVNATEYLPFFIRYKTRLDQLERFTEDDWKNVGMYNRNLRQNLLDTIRQMKIEQNKKICEKEEAIATMNEPNCSLPQTMIMTHRETECCICLNEETKILFMDCGHICCCEKCSNNLKECPLCRNEIKKIIKLMCW